MQLTLYTIQQVEKIDSIKNTGRLICTENLYSPEWDNEYKWMAKQMTEKIGKPKIRNQYPLWAWYQWKDESKKKPDLRSIALLPTGTKSVRIEFQKEESQILLSDFVLWHFPLSYKTYIGDNEKDGKRYDKKLKQLGLYHKNFNELPSDIKLEIEASWQKIFDMDFEDTHWTHKKSKKAIQATYWELLESDIVKVDYFTAR